MRRSITFTAETTKNFVPNSRRGQNYKATIQNLSGQSITITVTNQDIHSTSPTFDTPATAVVIANGAIGTMLDPYDGWLITAAGSTTGTVEVFEDG